MSRALLVLMVALSVCVAPVAVGAPEWAQRAEQLRKAGKWGEAAAALQPVAERGEALAQVTLGNLLLAKANPERDEATGYRWLRLAALQGNVNALSTLGYPTPYVAETHLDCPGARLTIFTSCRAFGPDQPPFCFAQTFLFELSTERAPRRAFTDTYRDPAGAPMIAVRASCLGARAGYVIEYSSFGNGRTCTGCEDRRAFDQGGRPLPARSLGQLQDNAVGIGRFPNPSALETWFKE